MTLTVGLQSRSSTVRLRLGERQMRLVTAPTGTPSRPKRKGGAANRPIQQAGKLFCAVRALQCVGVVGLGQRSARLAHAYAHMHIMYTAVAKHGNKQNANEFEMCTNGKFGTRILVAQIWAAHGPAVFLGLDIRPEIFGTGASNNLCACFVFDWSIYNTPFTVQSTPNGLIDRFSPYQKGAPAAPVVATPGCLIVRRLVYVHILLSARHPSSHPPTIPRLPRAWTSPPIGPFQLPP